MHPALRAVRTGDVSRREGQEENLHNSPSANSEVAFSMGGGPELPRLEKGVKSAASPDSHLHAVVDLGR